MPFIVVVNKSDVMTPEFAKEVSSISFQEPRTKNQEPRREADNLGQTSDLRSHTSYLLLPTSPLYISARNNEGIDVLKDRILQTIGLHSINTDDVLISNIRHLEALQKTEASLNNVLENIDNPVTSDFLATDIKQALYYLGEITGQVTTDDLLETIFSKFCIGK